MNKIDLFSIAIFVGLTACGPSIEEDRMGTSLSEAIMPAEACHKLADTRPNSKTLELTEEMSIEEIVKQFLNDDVVKLVIRKNVDQILRRLNNWRKQVDEFPVTALDLSGSDVTPAGLRTIASWDELETLSVKDCTLKALQKNAITSGWKGLRWIDLTKTDVSENGLSNFADMPNIQVIGLGDNPRLQKFAHVHVNWPSLLFLDMHSTDLKDPILGDFSHLTNVVGVALYHPEVKAGAFYVHAKKGDVGRIDELRAWWHNVYAVRKPMIVHVAAFLATNDTASFERWVAPIPPVYLVHTKDEEGLLSHLYRNSDTYISKRDGICAIQ